MTERDGFRWAICNETWGDLPFAETCRRIAAAGYDGVEIAPFTLAREWGKPADELTEEERTTIRQTAEQAGLQIVGLHWLLVPPPEGLHLTCDDQAIRFGTGAYLRDLAHLCADLGGKIMVLGSPKQRNIDPATPLGEGRQRFVEALRLCLVACEERGVTLCLEPLGPEETNFLNLLYEARSLALQASEVADVHPRTCRSIFDVKAAATEGVPFAELIEKNADLIAHVHANDVNRKGPGFGETDFVPILDAMKTQNYTGWVSVEVFDYAPDPDTVARVSLETLKAANAQTERS